MPHVLFLLTIFQRFFQSSGSAASKMTIEWTNQHGCGGNEDSDPHKVNCNIVLQYMVSDVCDYDSKLHECKNY